MYLVANTEKLMDYVTHACASGTVVGAEADILKLEYVSYSFKLNTYNSEDMFLCLTS